MRSPLLPGWTASRPRTLPVLVVEDDEDVRAALANLLTRWHIAFEMFAEGEAALQHIDGGARYGILLADYRLAGGMNGLDLIAAVMDRHSAPAPQAVLITGDFDPELIGRAHAAQVPLLHKPLRPQVLRSLLGIPEAAGGEIAPAVGAG
jgi:CheY-like chemotaxis protein